MTAKRVERGLFGLAWVALGVALLGVRYTPSDYCVELDTPAGQILTFAGLVVAAVFIIAAVYVAHFRDDRLSVSVVAVGVAAMVFAAGVLIAVYQSHHMASWSCG